MNHVKKETKVSKDSYQRKKQGKKKRMLNAKSALAMFLSVILVFQSVDSAQAAELTSQVSETAETTETPENRVVIILEFEVNDETGGAPEGNSSDVPETLEGGSDDTPEFLESTDAAKTPAEDTEGSETDETQTETTESNGTDETQTETTESNGTDETQTETTEESNTDETQTETTEESSSDETQAAITGNSSSDETPAETTEDNSTGETSAEVTEYIETVETQTENAEDNNSTETTIGETGGETAENPAETERNDETAAETITEETIIEEMIAAVLKEAAESASESGGGTTVVVSRTADVVFVIDVSGSMGGPITKVKNRIAEFNALLKKNDVDVRINFVLFSDITNIFNGEIEKTQITGWNSTTEEATTALNSITMLGGGDGPETPIDGMGFMFQDDFGWRENVAKFSILLTDAPYKPNNTFNYTDQDIATKLKDNNIVSSVIAKPTETCYDKWIVNGGQKGDITGDYQFLLDWVEDVIIPGADAISPPSEDNKPQHVIIEVRKDNVPWMEHGKNFILQNLDNGSYAENFNAVENGNYRIYEVTVSDGYLDTKEGVTVDGKDRTAIANYYTVYFVDGDNVYETSEQASQIVLKGQTASKPNSPTKPGYSFEGWVTENNGMTPFNFSQGIDGTRLVYAKWKENNVTIEVRKDNVPWMEHGKSFILHNPDNGSYVESFNAVENGNYRIYEVTVSDGYLDTGEGVTVDGASKTAIVDYYTVYFVDGDNIYDQTSDQASQIVLKGHTASQPNSPEKPGYSFENWMTENNGMIPFSFSQGIDGTTYVYANWKENTYSIERINEHQPESFEEVMEYLVDISSPVADTDAIVFVDVSAPKDNEPKTGDTSHVEIYATIGMISGLFYLLLYFTDRESGMTEEQKKEIVGSLVEWARKGTRIRKYVALAIIFVILVYYHSIGKRTTAEWKTLYER